MESRKYYVQVIRTDSDLDAGYGPFDTEQEAYDYHVSLNDFREASGWPDWLDDYMVIDRTPEDAVYAPGSGAA